MGQQFKKEASGDTPRSSRTSSSEMQQIQMWRTEIASYHTELLEKVDGQDPDEIMVWLSGASARLAEMRSQSWDMRTPAASQLRSRHIDPMTSEIDRQFSIASRRLAHMEWELRMTRGQT